MYNKKTKNSYNKKFFQEFFENILTRVLKEIKINKKKFEVFLKINVDKS